MDKKDDSVNEELKVLAELRGARSRTMEKIRKAKPDSDDPEALRQYGEDLARIEASMREMHTSLSGKVPEKLLFDYTRLVFVKVNGKASTRLRVFKKPTPELRLQRLALMTDLLPSPQLRKQVKKMLADQQAHVSALQNADRPLAAKWIIISTYFYWIWYVFKRPAMAATKTIKKLGGA